MYDNAAPVAIIGGGPAGANCAVWLALQGIECVVIEREATPMSLLRSLDFPQSWVLGEPDTSTANLATRYEQHLQHSAGVVVRCNCHVCEFVNPLGRHKKIVLSDGSSIDVRAIIFATGLRPHRPECYFGFQGHRKALDAITLTQRRAQLRNHRILILGGGDNGVENAIYLAERGNQVVIWSRGDLRARGALKDKLRTLPAIEWRVTGPLPNVIGQNMADQWIIDSLQHGAEEFDQLCVMYGFEPENDAWQNMVNGSSWRSLDLGAIDITMCHLVHHLGLFVAGDVSGRLHPCISCAIADGITAAKQVAGWIDGNTKDSLQ